MSCDDRLPIGTRVRWKYDPRFSWNYGTIDSIPMQMFGEPVYWVWCDEKKDGTNLRITKPARLLERESMVDSELLRVAREYGFDGRDIHNDFVVLDRIPPHKYMFQIANLLQEISVQLNRKAVAKLVFDVDDPSNFAIELTVGEER